jgi:hypothetical protein
MWKKIVKAGEKTGLTEEQKSVRYLKLSSLSSLGKIKGLEKPRRVVILKY